MIIERLNDGKAEAKAKNPDYKEGRKYIEVPEIDSYKSRIDRGGLTVTASCSLLGYQS